MLVSSLVDLEAEEGKANPSLPGAERGAGRAGAEPIVPQAGAFCAPQAPCRGGCERGAALGEVPGQGHCQPGCPGRGWGHQGTFPGVVALVVCLPEGLVLQEEAPVVSQACLPRAWAVTQGQ